MTGQFVVGLNANNGDSSMVRFLLMIVLSGLLTGCGGAESTTTEMTEEKREEFRQVQIEHSERERSER